VLSSGLVMGPDQNGTDLSVPAMQIMYTQLMPDFRFYYHGKTPGFAGGREKFDVSGIRWPWHDAPGTIMRC
jgi:hypothetical protein